MSGRPNQNGPTWEAVLSYLEAGQTIAGVDEVGRGAWAGPVVAGAVILPPGLMIDGVNDSKLVPARRRLELDRIIRAQALAVGLGWVAPAEVDEYGLSWAVAESGRRAIAELTADVIILDGTINYLADTHESFALVRADSLVMPVAAASIIAKVARDKYMLRQSRKFTGFGFETHVGYGTSAHAQALADRGVTPLHRLSYRPVKAYVHD